MDAAGLTSAPAGVSFATGSSSATAPGGAGRPAALVVRLAVWYVGIFAALAVALQPTVIVIDRAAAPNPPPPAVTSTP